MTTAFTTETRKAVASTAYIYGTLHTSAFGGALDRHTEAGGLAASRFSMAISEGSADPGEQPKLSPARSADAHRPAAASALGATRAQRVRTTPLRR